MHACNFAWRLLIQKSCQYITETIVLWQERVDILQKPLSSNFHLKYVYFKNTLTRNLDIKKHTNVQHQCRHLS